MNDEQIQCLMAAIIYNSPLWEPTDGDMEAITACADTAVALFRATVHAARNLKEPA